MRKAHLTRVFLSSLIVCGVAVWAACGGSEKHDVLVPDSGTDTGTNDEDSGGGEDAGDQDTGVADTGADVKVYDAGQPNLLDGGDIEGGIPCVVGGLLEEEPNDSTQEANTLTPTRCGVIRVVDGGGESDFLKFTLGDASTDFYLQYAGEVNVIVETDGSAPVDLSTPNAKLDFRKGQPYFVQVKSKNGTQQLWRVTLFEQ